MTSYDRTLSPGRGRHSTNDPKLTSTGPTKSSSPYGPYDAPTRHDYDDDYYLSDIGYDQVARTYHPQRRSMVEARPISSHRTHDPTTAPKKRTEYTVQPAARRKGRTGSTESPHEAIVKLTKPSSPPVNYSRYGRSPSPPSAYLDHEFAPASSRRIRRDGRVYCASYGGDNYGLDSAERVKDRTGHGRHRIRRPAHDRSYRVHDRLGKNEDLQVYNAYSYTTPREQFDRDYPVRMRYRGRTHTYGRQPSVTQDFTPPWLPPKDSLHGSRSRSMSRERLGITLRSPRDIHISEDQLHDQALVSLSHDSDDGYLSDRDRHNRRPHRSYRENANLYQEGGNSKTTNQEVLDGFRKPADGSFAAEASKPSSVASAVDQHRSRERRRSRRRGGHSDNGDMTEDEDLRIYRREPATRYRSDSSIDISWDSRDRSRSSHRYHGQGTSRGYYSRPSDRTLEVGQEDYTRRPAVIQSIAVPKEANEAEAPIKGIPKPAREAFAEDPYSIKGIALTLDAFKVGIPPRARWTKIDRRLVNPEALQAGNERYEERPDYVIVLRVLSKEEIQMYAVKTKEIREARRNEYVRDRGQTDRRVRVEDSSSDDGDESDAEPLSLDAPSVLDAQKSPMPGLPRALNHSTLEDERPTMKNRVEANDNDQTYTMRHSHESSELFTHGTETVRSEGHSPSMNESTNSPAINSQMDQATTGMEPVNSSSFHFPRQTSSPLDSGSPSVRSMATDISSPDLEDDSIDAGIASAKDMRHLLDSARYFSELDQLELRTAQILGLKDTSYPILASLVDCLQCLENWQCALRYLQSQGFCGSTINFLVEDRDQNDIASAFHISSDQIDSFINQVQGFMEPLNGPSIMELTRTLVQQILNIQDNTLADIYPMTLFRILCRILSIGLLSFSGSHVCRFDVNIWNQEMEEISIGLHDYTFKPRKLACLNNFIGGPVWVLSKAPAEIHEQPHWSNEGYGSSTQNRQAPQETQETTDNQLRMPRKEQQEQKGPGMKVSLTIQDLEVLWGPVSLVGGTKDEAPVIQTERGFIVPIPRQPQPSPYGIECHWTTEIPDHLHRENPNPPILLSNTSNILIGTTISAEIGLVVNENCKSSIPLIQQQIACRLQYPGTCKSRYVNDGFDIQLVGGQYVTAGFMKKYKRIPKRTLKAMLVEDCAKPDTKLVPLLNLWVGLEVSACSGNAQRVRLWDALRLSQTGALSKDNASRCTHAVGSKDCIASCWTRWQSDDEIDSLGGTPGPKKHLSGAEARRVIIHSILALEHSGVDSEGSLQVCWPFSHSPVNYPILPSSPNGSHHWFGVVKDSRDTSTFAVFSQRCLEFPDHGFGRSCSALCRDGHCKPLQSILATRIVTFTEEKSLSGLLQGARFAVGDAHLTVTKVVRDQVAIIAAISMNPLSPLRHRLREILLDVGAFEFKEHIRPDITTDLSVPVFAY